MIWFTIDRASTIAVYAAVEDIPAGDDVHAFTSEAELGKLLEFLSGTELAEVWNGFAGVPPFDDLKSVRKFRDRRTAVARIWKAVQRLDSTRAANTAPRARDVPPKANRSR
jgi:hypothetical protein